MDEIENTTLVADVQKCSSPPSTTITTTQRLIRLPHTIVKILFPSTVFVTFFISLVVPAMSDIIIPMFFAGNISEESALAVSSQFVFIGIVLKVIQDGVGNSLFHFVGAHYTLNVQLAISAFKWSLVVLLVCGSLITVMMLMFTQQFVKLIGTPETIAEATKHFFYTSAPSFIPTLLTTAFTNYLFISKSSWLVIAQVVIVLTSFLVNFFTFGRQSVSLHWGINEFGHYTVIQSTVTMAVSFAFVLVVEKMGPIAFFTKTSIVEDLKSNSREFFSVSWGNFAESIVRNFFYFFVTLRFVNQIGEDAPAAWSLFNGIIWGIILLPALAIANYIRVEMGHSNSKSTIRKVAMKSGMCLLAWIVVMTIFTGTMWPTLASFISKSNQKIALISERMFHDIGWIFVVYAYNNAVHSFLLATGKANYIFYQSLATNTIVYLIPLILHQSQMLTPTYWWVLGLYISGMLTNCCLASYFGVIVWKSIPVDLS